MPVPSLITDLSTVAASNSPDGASESPKLGDDYIRTYGAFIAQIRDMLNGTSNSGTIKNPVFSGTSTGTITIAGATLPSPTISGTPVISSAAVTWSGNPTHSGNHTWSGTQTFNGAATFGGAVTFSSLPRGFANVAGKATTTSRASNTSFTSDPDLYVTLTPGSYALDLYIPLWSASSGTGGFKWQFAFSGTTSAPTSFGITGALNNNAVATNIVVTSAGYTNLSTSAYLDYLSFRGIIVVATGGLLEFQWGQFSSSVGATNVGAGAWLVATKLT